MDQGTVTRIKHMAQYMDKDKVAEVFKLPADVIQDILDGQIGPLDDGSDKSPASTTPTKIIEKVRYIRHRTVTAIAPSGGVGKTTLLISLAVNAAAQTQRPVALVDFSESADLSHHLAWGLFPGKEQFIPTPSLWPDTTPTGEMVYKELLLEHPDLDNLYLLPGEPTYDSYKASTIKDFQHILLGLKDYFETVFVDLPSSPAVVEELLGGMDLTLMVSASERVAISNLSRFHHTYDRLALNDRMLVVLNKVGQAGGFNKGRAVSLMKEAAPGTYVDAFLPFDDALVGQNKVEYILSRTGSFNNEIGSLLGKINPDWASEPRKGGGLKTLLGRLKR